MDIDVSKCEYYWKSSCLVEYNCFCGEITGYDNCKDHKDCYYKQLQQANAKLEKIKEIADGTYPSGGRYIGKTDILKIIESEE